MGPVSRVEGSPFFGLVVSVCCRLSEPSPQQTNLCTGKPHSPPQRVAISLGPITAFTLGDGCSVLVVISQAVTFMFRPLGQRNQQNAGLSLAKLKVLMFHVERTVGK